MGRRRLPDPAWKSGPTYDEPTASEHTITPEDFAHGGFDFDGFGVEEAKQVEGEPMVTIQERATCSREGCDATHKRRLLFTTETLSDDEQRLRRHSPLSTDADVAEHVWNNAERVGPETIEVNGVQITAERIIDEEPHSACYGRVEPDYESQWRDI